MDWYDTVFELIDMRSFSNLWYWIVLAVVWSSASHFVLGVPFDLAQRAQRNGGQAQEDLEDLVRINVNRLLYIVDTAGLWLTGGVAFGLTVLALLGFVYGIEFCQAVFLLALPMSFVAMLSTRTARKVRAHTPHGGALFKTLRRHRLYTQFIGMLAIFVTALWGMLQNMHIGVLGG